MKRLKEENKGISTILAFALVPISGIAMDVYIPSFPQMAEDLQVSAGDIKLTLSAFLISYGASQLFVGSLVDSYGRYKLNLMALAVFTLSCLGIVATSNLPLILALRFIQGIAISFIVVCKRAFFIDVYEGEKRKHYTSMLTVVWSTAPIVAPFIGGFLQEGFGWRANFSFLAIYGCIMFLLELYYSGETIAQKRTLDLVHSFNVYKLLLRAADFSWGIVVLGFSYCMVMVFGMSIPFIIEHEYNLSPLFSGYCALISGVAIFLGGLLSKNMMHKPVFQKLQLATFAQLALVILMFATAGYFHSLPALMVFVFLIHLWQGFTYNTYFTYALTSQPQYAATASGLISGGSYIVFSFLSYAVVNMLSIHDQWTLGVSYLVSIIGILLVLFAAKKKLQTAA